MVVVCYNLTQKGAGPFRPRSDSRKTDCMRENITITLGICEITDQEITDFSAQRSEPGIKITFRIGKRDLTTDYMSFIQAQCQYDRILVMMDFSVALLEHRKNSLEKIDSRNFWEEVNQVAQRLDSLLNGFLSQVKIKY